MYRACADVLALAVQLPVSPLPGSATELRQQLVAALDKMVSRGRRAELPPADLAEARYALVALLDEQVLHVEKLGVRFRVRQDLDDGGDTLVVVRGGHPFPFDEAPECISEAWRIEAIPQALSGELIVLERALYLFVLRAGYELQLAELHRLETARGIQLVAKLEEPDLGHRLEDVDLSDEHFFDPDDGT